MTKPLKARSTRFEKIQMSTSATLGCEPGKQCEQTSHPWILPSAHVLGLSSRHG